MISLISDNCQLITDNYKKAPALIRGFFLPSAMTLGAAFLFTGFLEVSPVAELFERAFLVQFLFETAKRSVDRFTFFQTYFRSFHS